MTELITFKKFKFNYAKYDVQDSEGNSAQLRINYKKKSFKIALSKNKTLSSKAEKELKNFANDLLKRKSDKNFAQPEGTVK